MKRVIVIVAILCILKFDIVNAEVDVMTSGNVVGNGVDVYDVDAVDVDDADAVDVDDADSDADADELKEILFHVRNVDIFLQYTMYIVFAGLFIYITIWRPLSYFIDI